MKFFSLLFCLGLFFLSCNNNANTKDKPELQKDSILTNKNIATEKTIGDSNNFYVITAKFPLINGDTASAMATFVKTSVLQKLQDWKVGGTEYKNWQELNKSRNDSISFKYIYDITYSVDSSVVAKTKSYIFTTYEFIGGANGSSKVNAFSYKDTTPVGLDDVLNITNNNDIAILKLILLEAGKNEEVFPNKEMIRDGLGLNLLKKDGVTLDKQKCKCDGYFFGSKLQQFAISDKGIAFLYNKYDIAPGSSGNTEVLLTWAQLKPYLQSKFLQLAN